MCSPGQRGNTLEDICQSQQPKELKGTKACQATWGAAGQAPPARQRAALSEPAAEHRAEEKSCHCSLGLL